MCFYLLSLWPNRVNRGQRWHGAKRASLWAARLPAWGTATWTPSSSSARPRENTRGSTTCRCRLRTWRTRRVSRCRLSVGDSRRTSCTAGKMGPTVATHCCLLFLPLCRSAGTPRISEDRWHLGFQCCTRVEAAQGRRQLWHHRLHHSESGQEINGKNLWPRK